MYCVALGLATTLGLLHSAEMLTPSVVLSERDIGLAYRMPYWLCQRDIIEEVLATSLGRRYAQADERFIVTFNSPSDVQLYGVQHSQRLKLAKIERLSQHTQ